MSLVERLGSMTELDALGVIGADVTPTEGGYYVEHCGKPMIVGSGVFGPDVVRCEHCGARAEMVTSPHINGGRVLTDEAYREIGDRSWVPYPGGER